ncbi:hypothetical protein [Vibrio diabolicus]|uniref:hypothetical protein n=1 Tax=Vibrio diabolicus TaxID=50719 RepID=UPI0035A93CF7
MTELDRIEHQIAQKVIELDKKRDEVIQECLSWVQEESNKMMRNAIAENPQRVRDLGTSGLKPIKDRFHSLNYEGITQALLGSDDIWLHKQNKLTRENCPLSSYMVHGNRLPEKIEEGLRCSLSLIGDMLLEYQLTDPSHWATKGEITRYRYGLTFGTKIKEKVKAYNDSFTDLYWMLETLDNARSQLDSNSALNLWDNA